LSEPYRRLTLEWYRDEDGTRVVRVTVSGPGEGERTAVRAFPAYASVAEELSKLFDVHVKLMERLEEVAVRLSESHDRESLLRSLRETAEIAERTDLEELATVLTLVDIMVEWLNRRPSPQA